MRNTLLLHKNDMLLPASKEEESAGKEYADEESSIANNTKTDLCAFVLQNFAGHVLTSRSLSCSRKVEAGLARHPLTHLLRSWSRAGNSSINVSSARYLYFNLFYHEGACDQEGWNSVNGKWMFQMAIKVNVGCIRHLS